MIVPVDRRGFGFGSGLIDKSHSRFIINIPKNASSFLLDWCTRSNNWNAYTIDPTGTEKISTLIIVLRDPIERWISGFAQYSIGWILNASRFFDTEHGPGPLFQQQSADQFIKDYNWLTERLIFDNLESFDDHVHPQHVFFENLLPQAEKKYFFLDENFTQQIKNYLSLPEPAHDLDFNDSNNNPEMKKIKDFLRFRIDTIPELKKAIKEAYRKDYELIELTR